MKIDYLYLVGTNYHISVILYVTSRVHISETEQDNSFKFSQLSIDIKRMNSTKSEAFEDSRTKFGIFCKWSII